MRTKIKRYSLIVCLFLFLVVVSGGGLHLSAGGAFIASVTGTPLLIYVFNRRPARVRVEADEYLPRNRDSAARDAPTRRTAERPSCEVEDVVRQ